MNSKRRRPIRLLALVAGAMLVAAACSSGTATTAPATAAPATAAPATAAPATAAPATAAPATAAPATAAPSAEAGNAVYTPLASPPCDLSGKNIYFLSVLKGHPTLRLWQQGFLDEAAAMGFKNATIASPDDADWAKSVALGEQILATETPGEYGMVFGFVDPSQKDLIKKFGDAGVPVVIGHVATPEGTYPGLDAWAAFISEKWGTAAADAIGEKIGGTGTVAITEGSFNVQEDAVAAAFAKEMAAKFPNVKVLKPQEEGFDPPAAIAKAVAILQANPDVVGALSTTGAGPVTWAGAADQTGRTVAAIGPDMTRPNLDAVRDGKIFALAAQPGYEEHQNAVDLIAQLMCGQTVPYANELLAPIVTADGLAPYYEIVDRVDARK
jgi:ribose transport system substrate-binding protein